MSEIISKNYNFQNCLENFNFGNCLEKFKFLKLSRKIIISEIVQKKNYFSKLSRKTKLNFRNCLEKD